MVTWLLGLLPSEGFSGLGVQDASFPGLAGGAGSLEHPPILYVASASHSRAAGFSGGMSQESQGRLHSSL